MKSLRLTAIAALQVACMAAGAAQPRMADPRLREISYDPGAVVTVPVQRGVVTLLVLDPDEAISEVAAGLGGDCSKVESAWCVAAQAGGRHVYVKPKSTASAANNLAVVTDRRTHVFRLEVLPEGDKRPPVFRLTVRAAAGRVAASQAPAGVNPNVVSALAALSALPATPAPMAPERLVAERLQARPALRNTAYAVAEGQGSQDIVPSLVFDDGRFTYLRFAGNREVPAVFQVLGDGSEALVNTRMEDDLLVVDRVSRRLTLRAGSAVVGIWNEAFDPDGVVPAGGTTVPGVQRVLKTQPGQAGQTFAKEARHD